MMIERGLKLIERIHYICSFFRLVSLPKINILAICRTSVSHSYSVSSKELLNNVKRSRDFDLAKVLQIILVEISSVVAYASLINSFQI